MKPDLVCIKDFVTEEDENHLIKRVNAGIWMNPFKRRVQHYGYVYDYRKRTVTEDMYLGTLPDWLQTLAIRLNNLDLMPEIPDQAIINEYLPGQGIAPHIDCEPCFGDTIASLSLGGTCIMDFTHTEGSAHFEQFLAQRSLVVMRKEARYDWRHGIKARKTDHYHGKTHKRQRRISLTFRNVIVDYSK